MAQASNGAHKGTLLLASTIVVLLGVVERNFYWFAFVLIALALLAWWLAVVLALMAKVGMVAMTYFIAKWGKGRGSRKKLECASEENHLPR